MIVGPACGRMGSSDGVNDADGLGFARMFRSSCTHVTFYAAGLAGCGDESGRLVDTGVTPTTGSRVGHFSRGFFPNGVRRAEV